MNLRTRIILVALLAATAAAVASFSAGRTMQQDAEARYSAAILGGKQTLWDAIATTQVNQLALAAQGVGTDAGIASALRAGDAAALAVAAQSAFELLSDEIFTELTLVDVDGQVVFPAAGTATRTRHPLLLQALAEGNLVRGLAPTDAGGFGAGAALPLFEGGKLVGAALVGSNLHTAIAEFARSDGSRVFLANADGRLLHGTDPPLYERLALHVLAADAAARMATVGIGASSFSLTAHPFRDAKGKPRAWLFTATDATAHLASQRRTQNIAYGGTALGLLLALGTLLEYSRRAFHPLVELTASVERLGAGETGVRVRTQAHDEIGTLGRSFNIMAERIEQSIEQERQLTERLRERVERLLEAVAAAANGDLTADVAVFHDQDAITALANGVRAMLASLTALVRRIQSSATTLTTGSTQIAAAAREQESAVTEQAATTSHIRATVAGITTTAQTLLRTMTETKSLALKTANSANAGRGSLVMMEEATQGMLEATDMIGSKLDVLSAKAAGITSVVTTITSVAAQANLLSLNAVIEAEKAGEFGMGFSVVANEIRRLADQTAVASWDIERMIREMLAAVSGSVTAVATFTKQIHVNVDRMHEINGSLQEVVQQVDTLLPRFEETHTAMEQQTEGAQQIDEAMEQLNVLARHSADAVRATNSIAQTLNDAAHGLHQETSRFTVAK